jgi:hypothetical protein
MVQHVIPSLVVKTIEQYEIFALNSYVTTIASFDLWMFRFRHDTFVLVINFINSLWVPCHVIVGLFEATNMSRVVMVVQIKDLLSSYNVQNKLIVYGKDKGGKLSTLGQVLTLIISYGPL